MSDSTNDWLYERASDLITAGISGGDAQDLSAGLNDLDALYETIKRLESKYLGETKKDVVVALKPSNDIDKKAVLENILFIESFKPEDKRGEE